MILIKNPQLVAFKNRGIDTKIVKDNEAERFPVQNPLILSYLIQNINIPVVITDLQDDIVFVNSSFIKTFGFQSGEVCNYHISAIFPVHFHNFLYKTILFESQNCGWKGEGINKKKNGDETASIVRSQLLFDKESFKHFIFYTFTENLVQ